MKSPDQCTDMSQLRQAIDEVDRDLVRLFIRRTAYIDRAAVLKGPIKMPARVTDRVEEVVQNVKAIAEAEGWDPALAEQIWRGLIEWAIAREEVVLGPEGAQ